MKRIPLKNYIILFIVLILTIVFTFYARNWYLMIREYNSHNSPILSVVNEINADEIGNYAYENPKFVLYVSSGSNDSIKYFEKQFKKYVSNNNLEDSLVYVNIDRVGQSNMNIELKKYANYNVVKEINASNNISLYIFENGKIVKVINGANEMSIKRINSILKIYKVLDNA